MSSVRYVAKLVRAFLCGIGRHQLVTRKLVRGTLDHGVRMVGCEHCKARWIMSDEHRAFLRIEPGDAKFKRDLLFLYPNLRESDL